MHQSPLKLPVGPRRAKYAALEAVAADAGMDRRLQRGEQPRARKFHLHEEGPREGRSRQHPRG